MEEIALHGVTAILANLGRILWRMRWTAKRVVAAEPDVLVIIDCPGFNLGVARRVRKARPSIPIVEYVSPSVWAWRPGRARWIKGFVDHILALLPFEPAVHARLGGPPCSYVGHPLTEQVGGLRPGFDEQQRELWRRGAEGWRRRQGAMRENTAPVSRWLVEAIDPQPGQRVLELAAGPGETGFIAAQRLGPEGRLLCTDQAPEMVEVARERAAELELSNVEFAVVDAQQLDLAPASFDAALCRWGYMLMGDPGEAMRRTRLALREGGRLALATWDRPDRNLWMAAPFLALVAQGALPPPAPGDPSPFALHDPADLEARLRAAGFSSVRGERLEFSERYSSFDGYWAEMMDLAAPRLFGRHQFDNALCNRHGSVAHGVEDVQSIENRLHGGWIEQVKLVL